MSRYRKRRYSGYDSGHEAARRHIREAQEFSKEIGGTDKDVKDYFFKLGGRELEFILVQYGSKYGRDAEEYARKTMSNWKRGSTKMSGLVAKRLFDLLPPRMPLSKKYELAENIWKHFGPNSRHSYTIGPNADVSTISEGVSEKLDEVVTIYSVPENVRNRFNWLASGDVQRSEKLLNHFRQAEKSLAVEKINLEVPVLQRQVREHSDVTGRARSIILIHKHEVSVWVDGRLDTEIREGAPIEDQRRGPYPGSDSGSGLIWIAVVIGVILFFVFAAG